jgi:hypothetical protein
MTKHKFQISAEEMSIAKPKCYTPNSTQKGAKAANYLKCCKKKLVFQNLMGPEDKE